VIETIRIDLRQWRSRPIPNNQRPGGFSLVELLVGMAIAVFASIVIMQVLTNTEAGRRAAGGISDSQTNGMIGLFSIERDLQQSGLGISSLAALGCRIRSSGSLNGKLLSTAMIVPAGAAANAAENPWGIPPGDDGSDMIVITYGSPTSASEGSLLTTTTSASPYRLESVLGYQNGEYMLVAQQDTECTLGQVTATNPTDSSMTLDYSAGVTYQQQSATAFGLGRDPRIVVYAVRNGRLTVCNFLDNNCSDAGSTGDDNVWVPVASDVVALVAQYGWDTTGTPDKAADVYCKSRLTPTDAACPAGDDGSPAPGNAGLTALQRACDWTRVMSIRIAVVTRSGQYDKEEVSPATIKLWPDSAVAPSTEGPEYPTADRHYRYRVATTTVALRNIIWMKAVGGLCAA
jgi:type IV pilus assembly protein PilW